MAASISIVVPAYNAEATLPAALRSILGQSWENLEVLVVDDASTDNTKSVIETFAMEDPRIFPLWHEENRGAYASRNTGLRAATGDYFTVHDSDDWSHPEKIAIQVRHLQNHPLCTTMGARLTNDLRIAVRPEGPRIDFENISSLMAPTSYFRELGGWDEIRGGADSEFYERLLKSRGAQRSMVMPDTPLTLIRSAEGSLTRQNATGLQTLRYGARREYVESYRAWHQTATSLTFQSGDRPFPVPPILLRNSNSRQYDAIYVLDFAVGAPVIPLMSAAINKGKSIAVVNWPTPATSGEKADPRLRAFLRTHMMDTIVAGDDATADEIIFAHRRLLDYPPKPLASLSGRRSFLS